MMSPAGEGPGGLLLGDQQLYMRLARVLAAQGMLSNMPSKSLGTLVTAMTTARFPHYPLAQSIATQTLLRLQASASASEAAAAATAAGFRTDAAPASSDAMETSTLSNIVSGLAKLGLEHETFCDSVANWMMQRLSRQTGGVQAHHIVDVTVAFTRLKYENPDYLAAASKGLLRKLPQTPPNAVAMMVWALANSRSGRSPDHGELLDALAKRMAVLHRAGVTAGAAGSMKVVPRHLACIVFAMSRVHRLHPGLMDAVAADVTARADSYQARQLCNILRAFTHLASPRPDMYDAACAVLAQRLRSVAEQSAAALAASPPAAPFVWGPQNYSDAAWSVALAGRAQHAPELMEMLAERIAETAATMGKASLVRAAQALAVANSTAAAPRAFDAIAQAARPLLVDLGPSYLAVLVDAFSEVQHPVTEDFWAACMDAAGLKVPHMDRPRADMQAAVQRLADAFRRHPATSSFPACQGHYVLPMLDDIVRQYQQGSEYPLAGAQLYEDEQ